MYIFPDTEYPPVPPLQLPSEIHKTTSKQYHPLKLLRTSSTTFSNLSESSTSLSKLSDDASEYIPLQESTSTLCVPHRRYNIRNLPTRTHSTYTSTLNFYRLSSNSALRFAGQHAQALSSEIHSSEFAPQSYFTADLDTASLFSSDVETAFLSGICYL